MKKICVLALVCLSALATTEPELRGDGSIAGPGEVQFKIEREGAMEEDLRVQAMIIGHRRNGTLEELLVSENIEVIPTKPSVATLRVSEENFRKWRNRFAKITTGLRVIPRPGSHRQWRYESLLDPRKNVPVPGLHQVHGRWTAE